MSRTTSKFAPQVRERAIRMELGHETNCPSRWASVVSIAEKVKSLERENRELR
jgi:transposase